jgi:hypothetical protein
MGVTSGDSRHSRRKSKSWASSQPSARNLDQDESNAAICEAKVPTVEAVAECAAEGAE